MADLHVPAVSLAVIDQAGEVLSHAWGVSHATLFQAASISKPITAMAVMRLAAEGVFDLDDEVNAWLSSWRLPDGDGVTIRRVLSHSSGLSVTGFPGHVPGEQLPSLRQVLDGLPPANTEPVRVVHPPGEAYLYSGGAFTLLQLLLEDVSGEPFPLLMRRNVLDPLGMVSSTFEQPLPDELHTLAATGYDFEGVPVAGRWGIYPEAAGGLWSTASELALAVAEMIRPGRVLDVAQRDAMLTPHVVDHHGLGWALDGMWFQHGGSNAGFHCLAYGSAMHGQGAVVMVNGEGGWSICEDLIATIAEAFEWPDYLVEIEELVGES